MRSNVHPVRIRGQARCAPRVVVTPLHLRDTLRMTRAPGEPGHQLRAWRKHRGKTLEQASEFAGITHQTLGKIERGKVPYGQALLERLADYYNTDPGSLIMRPPESSWSIQTDGLRPEQVDLLQGMAEQLKRTGTGG